MGKLLERAKLESRKAALRTRLGQRYQVKRDQRNAGAVGSGLASIRGQLYDVESSDAGATVLVENVGRPAAAVYAPIYGGGGTVIRSAGTISSGGGTGTADPTALLVDGSRSMTGDLDLGGNAIVSVGNVDGVDVSAHASRHESGGADAINHDSLTGFVANEHINHTGVSITAGSGLTGGGTIAATRTINVGAGDGISVAADSVAVNEAFAFDWTGPHTFGTYRPQFTGSTVPASGAGVEISYASNVGVILSYDRSVAEYKTLYLAGDTVALRADDTNVLNATSSSVNVIAGADLVVDTNTLLVDASENRVGIGTATPAATFHLVGTARVDGDINFVGAQSITTTSGNLTIDPAGNVDFPNAQTLGSTTFDSSFPIQGWRISEPVSGLSNLTIGQIQADELSVKIFVADETRVDRGDEYWAKSYGIVAEEFTTPASTGSTVDITFEDSPAITGNIFEDNDWLLFRLVDNSGSGFTAANIWGQVAEPVGGADNGDGTQDWTFTLRSGATSEGVGKGAMAISFGASGQAVIHLSTVDNSGAPYIKMRRWVGANPYTPANFTTYVQIGNLDNISNSYVTPTGDGFYLRTTADESAFMVADDNGLQLRNLDMELYNGSDLNVWISADGNVNFGNALTARTDDGFRYIGTGSGVGDLRIGSGSGARLEWDDSESTLTLTDTDFEMYNGANRTVWFGAAGNVNFGANLTARTDDGFRFVGLGTGAGDLRIGANGGQRVEWDQSEATLKVYGAIEVQAASNFNGGYLRVGTGDKDSTLDGWVMDSGEIVGQASGADQVVLNTSGQIRAGGTGLPVTIDSGGIDLEAPTVGTAGDYYEVDHSYTISTGANVLVSHYGNLYSSTELYTGAYVPGLTGRDSYYSIRVNAPSGQDASAAMYAYSNGSATPTARIELGTGVLIGAGTNDIRFTADLDMDLNNIFDATNISASGTIKQENSGHNILLNGGAPVYGVQIKVLNTSSGWDRGFNFTDDDDVIMARFGGFGSGQAFSYSYIGEAYNDNHIRFDVSPYQIDTYYDLFTNGNDLDTEGGDVLLGGGVLRMENGPIYDASVVSFDERSTTPGVAADVANLYVKADKLIVAWQDGVTTRYKYLDLTGTGTTWTHTTTAP